MNMTAEPTPIISDFDCTTYIGDSLTVLRGLPDESVQMCVTSPPYWGLRNYDNEGQIGLEETPEQYIDNLVEIFREVRRVLRNDGILWLNIGDSYAADHAQKRNGDQRGLHAKIEGAESAREGRPTPQGLKPKDLVGIPWLLAHALREPYYTGRIARELDRVWLAATIDGEGTICGTAHTRKDDGRMRTMPQISITNSSLEMLSEAQRIWAASKSDHMKAGEGHLGTRAVYRWIVHGIENKTALVRELYPYLIVKRTQALLAYNLLVLMSDAKRLGKSSQAQAVRDKREYVCDLMSRLNHAQTVDIPSWCVEPPSLHEQGWWLRSDCIWDKPNGMPESVTDRPTHSHEFIFMLSKSKTYFFDNEAVKEPAVEGTDMGVLRSQKAADGQGPTDRASIYKRLEKLSDTRKGNPSGMRNMRSVWHIPTGSYPGAHFAVFPKELPRRCIKAGSKEGDVILDPFAGSGTVGQVARELNRKSILIELNPSYVEQIKKRTQQLSLLS